MIDRREFIRRSAMASAAAACAGTVAVAGDAEASAPFHGKTDDSGAERYFFRIIGSLRQYRCDR